MSDVRLVQCPVCNKVRRQPLGPGQHVWMRCGRCKGKPTADELKKQVKRVLKRRSENAVYKAAQQESHAIHRKRLRLEIIAGYGGKCACCKEHRIEFLAIDHTYGGGNKDRRARSTGAHLYQIKRERFPSTFRVLCHNCNMARAYYKYCPHEVERLNRDAMLKERKRG